MTWQPIETAPRDGTNLIGATPYGVEMIRYVEEHYSTNVMGDDAHGWQSGWWGIEQDSGCKPEFHSPLRGIVAAQNQPTHWMPLPEPPQ